MDSNNDGFHEYCFGPDGGEWANDVNKGGGAYLYLNWAGYGSDFTTEPNRSQPIAIYAQVAYQGVWSGNASLCSYQRYEIYVQYWDTSSVLHFDNIGSVTLGHATNWAYAPAPGTYVYPNQSYYLPQGGQVSYISGQYLGDTAVVVPPGPGCNKGTHLHIEGNSHHGFGSQYEWRGEGPESFDYGPGLHIHESGFFPWDEVTWGTVMGFVGGRSYSISMWDNPNYASH